MIGNVYLFWLCMSVIEISFEDLEGVPLLRAATYGGSASGL